jgi:putative sterol carrier protein
MVTTVDPPAIKVGDGAKAEQVEVDMFMSADDGHKFWLGELNIPMAMARKKIKIDGSVGVLLKLLPAMQPAFGMYRAYLDERGFKESDA